MEQFKQITSYEVTASQLEDLFEKHLGIKNFSILDDQDLEYGQPHDIAFTIYKNDEADEFEKENIVRAINGESTCWLTSVLMVRLAQQDIIPEGEYLVTIDGW